MSEKKAKEKRRNEQEQKPRVRQRITATFFEGGNIHVSGFPREFSSAMLAAHIITKTIADYFVRAAKDGRFKNGLAENPRIILPGANLN